MIIHLISCVSKKLPQPAAARDLYCSDWFLAARALAEAAGPWFILSAKHGLVLPNQMIEPYDVTLLEMPIAKRRRWADRVRQQMDEKLPEADTVRVFAGARYREFLEPYLLERFSAVDIPMARLRQGEQRRWMKMALTAGIEPA